VIQIFGRPPATAISNCSSPNRKSLRLPGYHYFEPCII